MTEKEILYFADAGAWERWLAANHAKSPGVQLAIAKKAAGVTSVSYPEALDVALCYGWIDSISHKLDDTHFLQSFTPRRARSLWSQINRGKVAALIAAGRMRPPGQVEIDRAKADGRWDAAYAGSKTIEVPADLTAALATSPKAKAFFATLSSQNRYAILFRLGNVKKAETRQRNLVKFVAMLERGETIYPQGAAKTAGAKKAAAGPGEKAAAGKAPAATGKAPAATGKKPAATGKKPAATGKKPTAPTGKKPAARTKAAAGKPTSAMSKPGAKKPSRK